MYINNGAPIVTWESTNTGWGDTTTQYQVPQQNGIPVATQAWGNTTPEINVSLTVKPELLNGQPDILELIKAVIINNKEEFAKALSDYSASGHTSDSDAFTRTIANPMMTALFKSIPAHLLKAYAESLANGSAVLNPNDHSAIDKAKRYFDSLSPEDKESYTIVDTYINFMNKTYSKDKIDMRKNKTKNKKLFTRSFAQFLISSDGSKIRSQYDSTRYGLDKCWEIYTKM